MNDTSWVVITGEGIAVKLSVALILEGPASVTQWLQEQGYAVESQEDWHVSINMPTQP